jgi:ATP-dependent Clp protease ATP-binding subunit ClpC
MDEAAAKLRVALHTLPPELKEMHIKLQHLQTEIDAASNLEDYQRAAELKTERINLQAEFNLQREMWQQENQLDETIEEKDIAEVVAKWTGIPVARMMETESEKLLRMEEAIEERIVGQEEAVAAVSDAIRRARSGLKDPSRPIGSFIFLGSSGVGKTELAKALAWFLFDDEDALVRIDMSEYRERHAVSRLFGAPPGYIGHERGGQLTEAVRRRPYRVVLFDEIEKAHPDVWNALLQILDEGRLTDGQGHIVNFRNTVVIMTSNVGTAFAHEGGTLGFARSDADEEGGMVNQDRIKRELKNTFRPEFLNRIDEVIVFNNLTVDDMASIVDLQMAEVSERLSELGLKVRLTETSRKWLARKGFDPQFGARPLRRALQRHVESPLSVKLLRGDFEKGDVVVVEVEGDELVFRTGTEWTELSEKTKELVAGEVSVES